MSKGYEPIDIGSSKADSRSLIMPHQQEAVDALTKYFEVDKDIPNRNGILVMPTGSGKTYTAVTWLLTQGVANGYRVVWLVHRQELVNQAYNEFVKQAPLLKGSGLKTLKVLPISGAHEHMSAACKSDVYVCSIASVANKYGYRFIERMIGAAGKRKLIIVVDEAHHAIAANYQKVIKRMTDLNNNRILLGLTATPKRMQEAEQAKLQSMFNINKNLANNIGIKGFIYEVTLKQLLNSGYLANPIHERVNTEIIGDVEFDIRPEDESYYQQFGELSERIKTQIAKSSSRNKAIVDQYLKNKDKYGKTLVFAVNQLHAETLCEQFNKSGIPCDYTVSGRKDAQEVIYRFKENKFKVLINVQIMTEGSDVPDIQTVFLTRQTNSDSLLMQMIGRALRGEHAGGTKVAHIVSFYDTWNTFSYWLDPGSLDIFQDEDDELITDEANNSIEDADISPNAEMLKLLALLNKQDNTKNESNKNDPLQPQPMQPTLERMLYFKLYNLMRASLITTNETPIFPCGWYSVVDNNGSDVQLLVYENQLSVYKNIEQNIDLINGKLDADELISCYFNECETIPEFEEIDFFLQYIEENGCMPDYFSFEDRDAYNPKYIAQKLVKLRENGSIKPDEGEEWLKELYEKAPVLQQIYKTFFAFKKTVFDAAKQETQAEIVTMDDRKEYQIVENYYNLYELLDEVLQAYPLLKKDGLVQLGWTKRVMKSFCARVRNVSTEDDVFKYALDVNLLFSSPNIDREVIKYLLFHELLHGNGYWNHDEEFRKREWSYPNSAELDGILDSLSSEYNIEKFEKYKAASIDTNESHPTKHNDNEAKSDTITNSKTDDNSSLPKGIQPGYKYCRNCGNKLPDTAKFCDKCGERMDY